MTALLFPPHWQPVDGNGRPYAGAKLYVYEAGTTNDLTVYQDQAGTTEHTQPIIADADGVFPLIYGNSDLYKFKLDKSDDTNIAPYDNVPSNVSDGGTLAVANGGTGSTTKNAARAALGAASQSDYTTLNSTVSTIDADYQALSGGFGDMASKDTVSYTDFGSDVSEICLQRIRATDNAQTSHTSTTAIPNDNTIPQSNEGVQIFSQAITPVDAQSRLKIKAQIHYKCTGTAGLCLALFRSGSTNAIAAVGHNPSETDVEHIELEYEYSPGSDSAITLSLRIGTSGGGDIDINPGYGGAQTSFLEILELQDGPITEDA